MTVFYSADPHYGHVKIADLCGRPYPDVAAMNADLIARWNAAVRPQDTATIAGDFALGRIADTLPLAAHLNGTLLLVPGNHDRCHPMHRQYEKWRGRYVQAGFAAVTPFLTLAEIAGRTVQVSHFPPAGDSGDADRHGDWRPVDVGDRGWVIHGHVHGRWRQHGRWINVGVDAWAGRPVSEHQVAELIAAGPRDLPPLPWDAP